MKNFKNDALTVAEQNNVEGGFFFLGGLVKRVISLPFRILGGFHFGGYGGHSYGGGYSGGCNSGCNSGCSSGCGSNGYRGW